MMFFKEKALPAVGRARPKTYVKKFLLTFLFRFGLWLAECFSNAPLDEVERNALVDVHDGVSGFDFACNRVIFGKFNLHRLCLVSDEYDAYGKCVECVLAAVYVDAMNDKRGSCAAAVKVESEFGAF